MSADDTQLQRVAYPPERLAGLRPFQPGQSGNPGGNYKGTPKVSVAYQRLLAMSPAELETFVPSNVAEMAALKRIKATIDDDRPDRDALASLIEVTDRTEGRAKQTIEHTGNAESERIVIRLQERFLARTGIELSREEAVARLRELDPALAAQLSE